MTSRLLRGDSLSRASDTDFVFRAASFAAFMHPNQRGRVFSYARYADILNEGMTLPDGAGRR